VKIWVIREEDLLEQKPPVPDRPRRSFAPDGLNVKRLLPALFFLSGVLILWWVMTYPMEENSRPVMILPMPAAGREEAAPPQPMTAPWPIETTQAAANQPPEIRSVEVIPEGPSVQDRLEARVEASDPEGDPILLSYTWLVNDRIIAKSTDPMFPGETLRKHDRVRVAVTPFDGREYGREVRSRPVAIPNHPPGIVSSPSSTVQGGVYTYVVQASDPDGDHLTYRLTQAPEGMSIEPDTGLIRWVILPGPSSSDQTVEVRVVVSDGDGAEAFQQFRLFLRDSS
jgi:hypothetical protein